MSKALPHICVCICTFKRPTLLRRLLRELNGQDTGESFTFSILVIDNDQVESARGVVENFSGTSALPVSYHVEPRQSIASARNRAVRQASGDFLAFIDDDEFPIKRWLLTLFEACLKYRVDGVLGPVTPHFDQTPPQWVVKGKFYDRPTYPTGFVIDWRKGRTGNVLLKMHVFSALEQPFQPALRNGEDQDFFRRAIDRGYSFVWCNEAVAYEEVPPIRWKRTFMLRRALLRGASERMMPTFGLRDIAKSVVAIPLYVIAIPFAFLIGQDRLMDLLVRLCDHLGRLLATIGINPVTEPYVTE
jgi:succinoglycan biosynthesis protein ExoM